MATITPTRRRGLDDNVVSASGPWSECTDCRQADLLKLRDSTDEVVLQGPLDVNVSVYAENEMTAASGKVTTTRLPLMSHDVSIPRGNTWRYGMQTLRGLGGNAGTTAWIRPARPQADQGLIVADDLPCDYAVRPLADTGAFFPTPCDPCEGGPIRVPPLDCGPAVDVLAARGGCVRPRYFNGMFITREDLDAEQRYFRLKLRMRNRAAGSGVVWGLDVALKGEHVVVGPGYGVDCCGNDLTITRDYAVPAPTLLRDPLVCGSDLSCYALLLEYAECAEDPRPIHGDGCEPRRAGCEMSRIRETARLRLVPPAATSPTPLGRFWTRAEALMDTVIGSQTNLPVAGSGPVPAPANVPVPFSVVAAVGTAVTLQPDRTQTVADKLPGVPASGLVKLEVVPQSPGRGLSGTVTSAGAATATLSANGVGWTGNYGPKTPMLAYQIDWSVASPDVLRGRTRVLLELAPGEVVKGTIADVGGPRLYTRWDDDPGLSKGDEVFVGDPEGENFPSVVESVNPNQIVITTPPNMKPPPRPGGTVFVRRESSLDVTIPPTEITMEQTAPATPCCDGCCGASEKLRPADRLRALLAALLYGRIVQSNSTLASDVRGARVLASLQRFLGIPAERLRDFENAVVELYRAWCASGVYPGPAHCDPDGVVIGCARVRSGSLYQVDPLDGRRWVIHPPLLDHWAGAFGLDPLDRRIGELYRRLCCLSHLPGFGSLVDAGLPAGETAVSPSLTNYLTGPLGSVANAGAPTASLGALASMTDLDLPAIALLVEELVCGTAPSRTQLIRDVERQRAYVAELFADLSTRDQPRQTLRETARDVARTVLSAVPAEAAVGFDNPLAFVFSSAGVRSLEEILSVPEDNVAELAIAVAAPEQIDSGLTRAQDTARKVVETVAEALHAVKSPQITKPEQLEDEKVARKLAAEVAKRLHSAGIEVDADAIANSIVARRT